MKIPLKYTIKNLWTRRVTTGMTIGGIALVVFVFAAVLMLAQGVKDTLVATGADDNFIVLRKGATSELVSSVTREQLDIISTFPEITKTGEGKPLASADMIMMTNLSKKESGDMGNIVIRGVSKGAFTMRPQVSLESGRWFQEGTAEVVVGNSIHSQFKGVELGDLMEIGSGKYKIVGIMNAGKTGFASEIWGDIEIMTNQFNRANVFSSGTFKLNNKRDFEAVKARMETDKRLSEMTPKIETAFYLEQSAFMAGFIQVLGLVVTIIFSFGAMIGAMITMYAAVANRTVEIGTLRALGFRRRSVLSSFLIESLAISIIGGIIGILIASLMQLVSFSTTNFGSFSELAFGFSMNIDIIVSTIIFAIVMGIVGGFLPAIKASRMNIVNALRSDV